MSPSNSANACIRTSRSSDSNDRSKLGTLVASPCACVRDAQSIASRPSNMKQPPAPAEMGVMHLDPSLAAAAAVSERPFQNLPDRDSCSLHHYWHSPLSGPGTGTVDTLSQLPGA